MKTAQEIERYVKHILPTTDDGKFTSSQIESYWVSIARLYHQIHCDNEAVRYLEEYLAIRPWDREANLLLGEICETSLKDYNRALDCYDRAAQEKPDPRGLEKYVARVCIHLAKRPDSREVTVAVEFILKGLQSLKQSRPFTGNLYSKEALDLMQQLFAASLTCKKPLPIAMETELLKLLEHTLDLEETRSNIRLVLNLLDLLIYYKEFARAWQYISDWRYIFSDSLEWNEFVCNRIEALVGNGQQPIDQLDRLYFIDALARSALLNCRHISSDLCIETILASNQQQLDQFQIPDDDLQTTVDGEEWGRRRLDYLSRHYLHLALSELRQLPTRPPRDDQNSQERAQRSFNYLLLSLSHMPADCQELVDQLALNERLMLSSRLLLTMLCCYRYEWLHDGKEPAFRSICLEHGYGDSVQFRLLHPKNILLQDRRVIYPLRLDSIITRVLGRWDEMDQSVVFDPWSLDRFLLAASWRVLDGSVRQWLRKIFPRLPEYPPQNNGSANGASQLKPVLAIADLEAFIILALIERHIGCVCEHGATTLGQVALFSNPACSRVRSQLAFFWQFVIFNYGSKSYVQRPRYMYTSCPTKSLAAALKEIRGTKPFTSNSRSLYLLVALVYKDMLDNYGIDRSVEAIHYFHAVQQIDNENQASTAAGSPLLVDPQANYQSLLQSAMDAEAISEEIEKVSAAIGTRYQQFVDENGLRRERAGPSSSATESLTKSKEPENVFLDQMDRLTVSSDATKPLEQQENKKPALTGNIASSRRDRQLTILKTLRSVSPDESFIIKQTQVDIPQEKSNNGRKHDVTTATAAGTNDVAQSAKKAYRSRAERLMTQLSKKDLPRPRALPKSHDPPLVLKQKPMPVIQIPAVYGWNILAATGIAFHCLITGFRIGGLRKKYNIPYPDMGNGRYAAKLTDDQWKDFNNYQRAHYNYIEGVASIITLQLLGGLFYPKYVAGLGAAYIVGREMYTIGYTKKGPDGRYLGALVLDLALFAKLGLTVYGALKLVGYV